MGKRLIEKFLQLNEMEWNPFISHGQFYDSGCYSLFLNINFTNKR
jgi:hypothetical protein